MAAASWRDEIRKSKYLSLGACHTSVCDLLINRGAEINKTDKVWDILYYTVMCIVVIDIIIIYYRGDGHLFIMPVIGVVSVYATFSSTGELMSI